MKTYLWALLGILACSSPLAAAAPTDEAPRSIVTIPEKDLGKVWVNIGGFSSHFARDKGYNENNVGFGIEYRQTPEIAFMAGSYYNSVRKTTNYAAVSWQPWTVWDWKLGAAIGLMDGYPALESGGTFFAALPMATYEGKRFGVNLGVIPDMPKVDGAIVIQFKFRL
jgi:hypothetical protein